MANLSAKAPTEPTKSGAFLHERSRIPEAPAASRAALLQRYSGLIVGIVAGLGLLALGFQARDTWDTHRDWVIPVTVPFFAIGGVAFGLLCIRGKANALAPGMVFLTLTLLFTVLSIWRGAHVDGSDAFRNVLTVASAVFLAATIAAFTIAAIVVEVKDPTRAPAPEM